MRQIDRDVPVSQGQMYKLERQRWTVEDRKRRAVSYRDGDVHYTIEWERRALYDRETETCTIR